MNIDSSLLNVVVFIDLKKAFDTIDHATLLRKLANYGLDLGSLRFFASYLGNRSQKCYVNGYSPVQACQGADSHRVVFFVLCSS